MSGKIDSIRVVCCQDGPWGGFEISVTRVTDTGERYTSDVVFVEQGATAAAEIGEVVSEFTSDVHDMAVWTLSVEGRENLARRERERFA